MEDAENDELRWANGRNADLADQPPVQDVVLRHGRAIARDEERVVLGTAEERPLPPLRSKEEADRVFAEAVQAGAQAVKRPHDVFWGGYSGYFADPDGHLWEVAWNPFFPLDVQGNLSLPD